MLVVMHYWNIQFFHQPPLNLKAFRGTDILEIYPSKGWCNSLDRLDELINVCPIYFDIEYVNVCERLEQKSFPLHHRLACESSDVSEAQNCSSVTNYGD